MKKSLVTLLVALLAFIVPVPQNIPTAHASVTITAASCSRDDVADAIDQAVTGDTVQIPACPSGVQWTKSISSYCSLKGSGYSGEFCLSGVDGDTKAITIKGMGVGQTVIIDSIDKRQSATIPAFGKVNLFYWVLSDVGISRITAIEFRDGSHGSFPCSVGGGASCSTDGAMMVFTGDSSQFRLDHNKYVCGSSGETIMDIGKDGDVAYIRGVSDHNTWDTSAGCIAVELNNGISWQNTGLRGDKSWAVPDTIGTVDAFYFEDETATNDQSLSMNRFWIDGQYGARGVVRYSTMTNVSAGVHGTDHAIARGGRQMEYYKNTVTFNVTSGTLEDVFSNRSGVAIAFGNVFTVTGTLLYPWAGTYIRLDLDSGDGPYGRCTGSNLFDTNVATTCYVGVDQVGVGYGDLMNSVPTPALNVDRGNVPDHPHHTIQPAYCWSNTKNGADFDCGSTDEPQIHVTRDIINDTVRPLKGDGVTAYCTDGNSCMTTDPYVYPHELVTLIDGGSGTASKYKGSRGGHRITGGHRAK